MLRSYLLPMKRILVLCTGNSARSQMAEGLLRRAGRGRFEVFSAGTKPSIVRPEAIAVMAELGIDLTGHTSKGVEPFLADPPDLLITVCDHAKETCPVFPARVARLHWPFEDPAAVEGSEETRRGAFRKVRDQIQARIEISLQDLSASRP